MSRIRVLEMLLVFLALFCTGSALAQDGAERHRRIYQAAVSDPTDQRKVEEFISTLVEVPAGSGRYIVEGDLLLSRDEIEDYLRHLNSTAPSVTRTEELIVNLVGGRLDYLVSPESRQMTYTFDARSFPDADRARRARENFQTAAREWEQICPKCGISFTEVQAGPNVRPYFVVRYQDAASGPIARAFFPSSPPDDREVVIFPGYFASDMGFDPVGVMRHEIGHILGYRHEHIRNIPGCFAEGTSYHPLTPYTPNSVMHYFCGGVGSFDLSIRDADKRGHQCLYQTGAPCPGRN